MNLGFALNSVLVFEEVFAFELFETSAVLYFFHFFVFIFLLFFVQIDALKLLFVQFHLVGLLFVLFFFLLFNDVLPNYSFVFFHFGFVDVVLDLLGIEEGFGNDFLL